MPGAYIPNSSHPYSKPATPLQTFIWLSVILVPVSACFGALAVSALVEALAPDFPAVTLASAAGACAAGLICFVLLSIMYRRSLQAKARAAAKARTHSYSSGGLEQDAELDALRKLDEAAAEVKKQAGG